MPNSGKLPCKAWRAWWLLACWPLLLGAAPVAIEVDGTGWLQNRRLARSLERLQPDPEAPILDANGVEDAVFFLFSALADEGYLKPQVTVHLTQESGETLSHTFDTALATLLPRPLAITRAQFVLEQGVRYHFDGLQVQGDLHELDEKAVRELIRPPGGGLFGRGESAYSPNVLRRGLGRVTDVLEQRGYPRARVEAPTVQTDDATGEVDVTVEVEPGVRWWISTIEVAGTVPEDVTLPELRELTDRPWNVTSEQDAMQAVREAFFAAGYPDMQVRAARRQEPPLAGIQAVQVTLRVTPGERVTMAPVAFDGDHGVSDAVLRRRVWADAGDPLNPLELERARFRLSRLGAFRRVRLHYEPEDGPERTPVFTLTPLPPWEVHLIGGYGSYEQLRGGVEVRRNNLLGRAHQARLELVQSFKSSRGELTYGVPELFGERVDGSLQLFGLRRDELAFVRQEYGGTVGLRRRDLPWLDAEGMVSYTFQSLQNRRNELTTREIDTSQTTAASIDLGLMRDRRDNPLRPRRGYRWYAQTELAAQYFGGDVDYQRVELGVAYHTGWGERRWLHAALSHGVVLTLGATDDRELPVNKRFYPGGDSSIRGYQLGEAAPRGGDGRFIGAKTSTLLNVEFEQALVGSLTGVVFVDALAMSSELSEYPADEYLVSVGAGLRYQTIVGPVRLEYGHNLRRRALDPTGTWHLSLGFPF